MDANFFLKFNAVVAPDKASCPPERNSRPFAAPKKISENQRGQAVPTSEANRRFSSLLRRDLPHGAAQAGQGGMVGVQGDDFLEPGTGQFQLRLKHLQLRGGAGLEA